MDISEIKSKARAYYEELKKIKREIKTDRFEWYPYSTPANFDHFDNLLQGENRSFLNLLKGNHLADIGGADGDIAFFMETLGYNIDIIDYGRTNFNGLKGAKEIKNYLDSSIQIYDIDLDSQFKLPKEKYDLVFFLGILYHLKNPFYALESLSKSTDYCFLSTKVAQVTPDKKTRLETIPVAYLLDTYEANNDPTNYWIFSDCGLKRLLNRTGWEVVDHLHAGCTKDSDPASAEGDERAFYFLKSVH